MTIDGHINTAIEVLPLHRGDTLYDYGFGYSWATKHFQDKGIIATFIDAPDIVEKEPSDYAFCYDVMETIPTDKIPETFQAIYARTKKTAYFHISTDADNETQGAADWWLDMAHDWWPSIEVIEKTPHSVTFIAY